MQTHARETDILAEKNARHAFCSCVYEFFFVLLHRILCGTEKTEY